MATNKNDVELEKLRNTRHTGWIMLMARLVDKLPWVCLCVFGYLSITELAGKETNLMAVARGAVNIGANEAGAYMVAVLCGVGYYRERRLRVHTVKTLGKYATEHESSVLAGRPSSGLTPAGQQQPEDRDVP